VVDDEPPGLDRKLHDVANLPKRVWSEERKSSLHQLTRHAVAASGERVVIVEILDEALPHGLFVGVVGRIDVHPALEPRRFGDEVDRGLIRRCGWQDDLENYLFEKKPIVLLYLSIRHYARCIEAYKVLP